MNRLMGWCTRLRHPFYFDYGASIIQWAWKWYPGYGVLNSHWLDNVKAGRYG